MLISSFKDWQVRVPYSSNCNVRAAAGVPVFTIKGFFPCKTAAWTAYILDLQNQYISNAFSYCIDKFRELYSLYVINIGSSKISWYAEVHLPATWGLKICNACPGYSGDKDIIPTPAWMICWKSVGGYSRNGNSYVVGAETPKWNSLNCSYTGMFPQ